MDVFGLQHKINILYREDLLVDRIALLYKWIQEEEISLIEFHSLVIQCNEEQVISSKKRRGVL